MFEAFATSFLFLILCYASFPLEQRIVGGQTIAIHCIPYQLSLHFQERFICGAVLITKNAALTSAHCILINKRKQNFAVRAGSSYSDSGGMTVRLEDAISHPKYDNIDYDIAVLRLKRSLPTTKWIKPIPISEMDSSKLVNKEAVVSGWGVTIPGMESSTSKILKVAKMKIVSRKECRERPAYHLVSERMLCAVGVNGKEDACQGDSGGPLAWNNTLIGIVAFGEGCGEPNYPGVYMEVSKFQDFIKTHISKRKRKHK